MSKFSKAKRTKMENLIYGFFDRIEPGKMNTNFYRSFFSKMSDKEFESFFDKFFKDENAYLVLTVKAFENDITIEAIENAAKFMNVPLYEHVVMPYGSTDKSKPVVTPYPVPVGYYHLKRLQQTAIKKNSTSIEITNRDAKTGQVVNHDKNSRQSIDENYCLMTSGNINAIKEFMGFRADDLKMKEEAYTKIRQDGYVSMEELPNHVENKTTLNLLDTYLISMGLKSDLVTGGYLLVKTLKK